MTTREDIVTAPKAVLDLFDAMGDCLCFEDCHVEVRTQEHGLAIKVYKCCNYVPCFIAGLQSLRRPN